MTHTEPVPSTDDDDTAPAPQTPGRVVKLRRHPWTKNEIVEVELRDPEKPLPSFQQGWDVYLDGERICTIVKYRGRIDKEVRLSGSSRTFLEPGVMRTLWGVVDGGRSQQRLVSRAEAIRKALPQY